MNHSSPLLLERISGRVLQWIRDNLAPFLSALIVGFASHLYAFTNKLVGFDELANIFSKGFTTSSGRWGLDLISFLFPDVSLPWFYGLISLAVLSVAACLMVEMFHFRSKLMQSLLTGTIMAFPSLTATVVFLYTLAPYAVSFLLAVVAVRLLQKESRAGFLGAVICLIFSLSIYQAYIALAASLMLLLLIRQVLRGENTGTVFRRGVCSLVVLIVSLGAYYLITAAVKRLTGTEFNVYAEERVQFSILYIPRAILEGYRSFITFFTSGLRSLAPTDFSRWIHVLCLFLTVALLGLWLISEPRKDGWGIALLLMLLFLLPPAMNAMYFFVKAWDHAIHTVVLYSYIAIYLFAAIVLDACFLPLLTDGGKAKAMFFRLASEVIAISLVAITFINVYVANATYFRLYMKYENTYSFYTAMLSDLREHPEFTPDTPVAICGNTAEPYFYEDNFPFTSSMFGASGLYPGANFAYNFTRYYIGIRHSDIPKYVVEEDQLEAIMSTEEYAGMECWPYRGYIRMIDDTLVVKLS